METVDIVIAGETIKIPKELVGEIKALIQAELDEPDEQPIDASDKGADGKTKMDRATLRTMSRLRSERDSYKARSDAATSAEKTAENKRKDGEYAEKIRKEVRARLDLEDKAGRLLGGEFKTDGKTDREIQIAIVHKSTPSAKFDGASDDYVRARFDLAIESISLDALAGARAASNPAPGQRADNAAAGDEHTRRDKAIELNANRGRAPLTIGLRA